MINLLGALGKIEALPLINSSPPPTPRNVLMIRNPDSKECAVCSHLGGQYLLGPPWCHLPLCVLGQVEPVRRGG